MLLSLLMITTLAAAPSGPDALVGIWGSEDQPVLTLYPERIATAGASAWLWTHEAQGHIRLESPSGKEPAQVLPYRLDGGKLVLTLPPAKKAVSLETVLLMAVRQGQQRPDVEKGATLVLERLPVPKEMIAPYSKTAPKALSDRYVRASGHIFHLTQGYFAGLSAAAPAIKRLSGVDAASFEVLWEDVARDRKHIYCPEVLAHADRDSFKPVPNEYAPWFKDRNGLWIGCERQLKLLPGQSRGVPFDGASFKVLSLIQVKDRGGTFRQSNRSEPEPSPPGHGPTRRAGIWLSLDDPRSKEERFVPTQRQYQLPPLFRPGPSK